MRDQGNMPENNCKSDKITRKKLKPANFSPLQEHT